VRATRPAYYIWYPKETNSLTCSTWYISLHNSFPNLKKVASLCLVHL
jgi:hypothetical protein